MGMPNIGYDEEQLELSFNIVGIIQVETGGSLLTLNMCRLNDTTVPF